MSDAIAVASVEATEWVAKTTDKGDALLAKLAEGHVLEITRALSGSGKVDTTLLKQQTAVATPQQTVTIQPVAYPEAKKCKLPITIRNDGLTSSYTATQIGVFANDPDEGEILFFLAQTDGVGTNIVAEALQPGYSADFNFSVEFGNADGVSVTVDPSNSVTQEGMENYVNTTIVAYQEAATTGGTGEAYTARVPGITALKPGVSFLMVPHVVSTTTTPTLNVNGLGAKAIRQPLTTNTGATTSATVDSWLTAGKPIRVTYDGTLWKIAIPRPSATTLYGKVGIENGGTDASTVADAQKNLQVAPAIESEEFPGCYYRTVDGETEWINPPMEGNVEYRTTERFQGKPVYTKQIVMNFSGGTNPQTAYIYGATNLWVGYSRRTAGVNVWEDFLDATALTATGPNTHCLTVTCNNSATVITQVKYTK